MQVRLCSTSLSLQKTQHLSSDTTTLQPCCHHLRNQLYTGHWNHALLLDAIHDCDMTTSYKKAMADWKKFISD
ncbi:hypothetical protein JOQ06_010455 [Pogonophryne albipinna]|uniref:Uncharacterized protein n=1 Tax=Pogonophryne albipinna TaxID=1090488 RepID=A0AAD6FEE8_9TELE|nr:hypothetical protein JOQ06_010455 [Pogonophryne albipinna]